jgi:hypothetical protein
MPPAGAASKSGACPMFGPHPTGPSPLSDVIAPERPTLLPASPGPRQPQQPDADRGGLRAARASVRSELRWPVLGEMLMVVREA